MTIDNLAADSGLSFEKIACRRPINAAIPCNIINITTKMEFKEASSQPLRV